MPSLLQRFKALIRVALRSAENPYTPLYEALESDADGGGRASSGVKVTRLSALRYPAVWRAVTLLSRGVGKLPLLTYRRLEEGGRERDAKHPIYRLLRRKPNPQMTAGVFKETLTAHAVLQGNGYAFIERDGAGRPKALWPLMPDSTWPVRVNGKLYYSTTVGTETRILYAEDVFHVRGLSYDGLTGYSVLSLARDSLGLGLAAAQYGSRFFSNDATPRVIFEFPGKMDKESQEEFKRAWNSMHMGLDNAHKTALITNGGKMSKWSIDARDAQLLETRQFENREVANWFSVPPHKLGDASKVSYNSLEQENQSYLDDALDPWLCAWEEEAFDKLLTEAEQADESIIIEFLRAALIRANLTARFQAYNLALSGGWMSRDEVRERENMNPIPDGQGKVFLVALNLGKAGGNPKTPQPAAQPGADATNGDAAGDADQNGDGGSGSTPARAAAIAESHRRILEDAYRRAVKRLAAHSAKAIKDPAILARLSDHADPVREILSAPIAAAAAVGYVSGRLPRDEADALIQTFQERAAAAIAAGPTDQAAARLEAFAAETIDTWPPQLAAEIIP